MYKCKNCGFECASSILMERHTEREKLGLTESEDRKLIKDKYIEAIKRMRKN